jgi:ParB family chromosome partitioning protein
MAPPKRGERLERRGQTNASEAIALVVEGRTLPGETIQQIDDSRIDDSPYQARQDLAPALADLVQGMRVMGFQGVLTVRPHGDLTKRRAGRYELVYGHRRRAAWRQVCMERGEAPKLPVVVREISNEDMLTIGAQENLNRADLNPVEEAQIVHWYEREFYPKSHAAIGEMLGKTEAWVALRARVYRLPDPLKDGLRRRPRAINQFLEVARLWEGNPAAAQALVEQIVAEELTVRIVKERVQELLNIGDEYHDPTFEPSVVRNSTDRASSETTSASSGGTSSPRSRASKRNSAEREQAALLHQIAGEQAQITAILDRWVQLRRTPGPALEIVDQALEALLTHIGSILAGTPEEQR